MSIFSCQAAVTKAMSPGLDLVQSIFNPSGSTDKTNVNLSLAHHCLTLYN